MPRANRYFIPGYIWHLTHRCHKKEFLVKFSKDKTRWIHWLFQAKKRYRLKILNYMVTSNHIHLLVKDASSRNSDAIPKSMQLIAGRTAQEYNQRKNRKGAFWEDRYHATAIENDKHLLKCMFYIDANMVRAGVVKHPLEWPFCGLHEILVPKVRYGIINHECIMEQLDFKDFTCFKHDYLHGLETYLETSVHKRESIWSESIAVGSSEFLKATKKLLKAKALSRKIEKPVQDDLFQLREKQCSYKEDGQNAISSNVIPWEMYS